MGTNQRRATFRQNDAALSSPFDYDALDEPKDQQPHAVLLSALVSRLTEFDPCRTRGDAVHRSVYMRICAVSFCLSNDNRIVSAMSPARVAARLGISRKSATAAMRNGANAMGLGREFDARAIRIQPEASAGLFGGGRSEHIEAFTVDTVPFFTGDDHPRGG